VDNPLCILTQANSKKFLISKEAKPERLFEFFTKVLGLEALELKYKSMVNTKEELKLNLKRKKSSIPELKAELKKWKKLLDSSERISDYRKELMWATVIEMQKGSVVVYRASTPQVLGSINRLGKVDSAFHPCYTEGLLFRQTTKSGHLFINLSTQWSRILG
ncbi:hypothetical protein TNCV_45741, partial [Trichonephila clavipes]